MSRQPFSLLLFKGVAVDDSSQVHPHNQSRWPPALSSHQLSAVTDKVNRLLTLSRVCSEELDFCTAGYLSATSKDQTHDGIRLSCRSDTIPARAPWGHPTPYLQEHQSIQVPTNKCNQEESLSMVHLRWFDRDTSETN